MEKSKQETIHVKFNLVNELFDKGFIGERFAAIKLPDGRYALVDISTQRIELQFISAEETSEGYILQTENGMIYVQTNRTGDTLQFSDYFKSLIMELFEGLLVQTFQESRDFISFSANEDQEKLHFGGWEALSKVKEKSINPNSVTCNLPDMDSVIVIRKDFTLSRPFVVERDTRFSDISETFRVMKDREGKQFILRIADMSEYGPVENCHLVSESGYVSNQYLVIHEGSKQMLLRISDFTVSTAGSSIKPIISDDGNHTFNHFILKIGEQEVLMRGSDFMTSRLADSINVYEKDGIAVLKTDGKLLAIVRLSDFKTIEF